MVPKPTAVIYSLASLSFWMRCIPSLDLLGESVFCISLLNISWIWRMVLQESGGFVDASISQTKLIIFWYVLEMFIESNWRALVSL